MPRNVENFTRIFDESMILCYIMDIGKPQAATLK